MTEQEYRQAKDLQLMIRTRRRELKYLDDVDVRNQVPIPEELQERHKREIQQWLEGEIARLEAEFDAL